MTGKSPKNARQVAAMVLSKFTPQPRFIGAGRILHKHLEQTEQSRLATDLVFGVIRNQGCIDTVITKVSGVPKARIPAKILNILRIGVYELLFCPETPEYAIINEAANQSVEVAGKKQTAFVNAVLRNINRAIAKRSAPLAEAEAQKTVPQSPDKGCVFNIELLPNPNQDFAGYLSSAFSLPDWLVSDWLVRFGEETTKGLCFASNRRPSIYIRPNTLKTNLQDLSEEFRRQEIDFEALSDESMIKLKSHCPITNLPGFSEGLFAVQDISAARVVKTLAPRPGWRVADVCAAPGTKTMQISEMMNNTGEIVATDINPGRLDKLLENCQRQSAAIVKVVEYNQVFRSSSYSRAFDAVLLDVPCSNTGVLARRCEARWRISKKSVLELAGKQAKLLQAVIPLLKPRARVCYSTCSIQSEENESVTKDFLSKNNGFRLESESLILPCTGPADHDGGYVTLLVRD